MSLYLGKDNNGNSKLVISRSVVPSDVLKTSTSLDNNIVFNSQIPYMSVFIKDVTNFSVVAYTSFAQPTYIYTHTFTTEELSMFVYQGMVRYMIPIINGSQVDFPVNTYVTINELAASYGITTVVATTSTLTIYSPVVVNSVRIVAFPFTPDGAIVYNPFAASNNIILGNGDLTLGGTSIFRYPFIVKGTVNSTDTVVALFGNTFQVINSSQGSSSGSIRISSNNNCTEILNNGKIVLSSTYSFFPLLLNGTSVQTKTFFNVDLPINMDPNITPTDWMVFNGFNFNSSSIYSIHVGVYANGVHNPTWGYTTWIIKADGQKRPSRLVLFPSYGGSCIGVEAIKVTTTSIYVAINIIIDSSPNGPDLNIYTGPYTYTFTCKQLTI